MMKKVELKSLKRKVARMTKKRSLKKKCLSLMYLRKRKRNVRMSLMRVLSTVQQLWCSLQALSLA